MNSVSFAGTKALVAFVAAAALAACSDKPVPDKAGSMAAGSSAPASATDAKSASPAASANPTPSAASTAAAAGATASASGEHAPATSGVAPLASGSAPAAAGGDGASLVDLFKDGPAEGATARPIFSMSAPSGVIVLVPKGMTEGSGIYGEGYTTTTEINQKITSHVYFEIDALSGEPKLAKLTDAQLKMLCYKSSVDKITWEPSVEVKLGPDATPAIAWRGKGTSVSKGEWGAYAVSTVVLKNKSITGCGGWDVAHPENEKLVLQTLRSIRAGQGVKTDPGNP